MTPEPEVANREHDVPNDWAASVAFGGQSSEVAAAPATDNGSVTMLLVFIGAILSIGFLRSWWFPGILGGLIVMLFMHEFGHYITARISGMKVTEFFIGFGPKIWSFNRGETEYGVKAIPAGAYVRIMGMTNLDDIDPAEEHRTYRSQPYWQRMMTICAGSAMHFLMATIALLVLFASFSYAGFNGPPWTVAQVVPGSTAATVGIEVGDQINAINGDGFDNWDQFGDVVSNLDEGPVAIDITRNGQEIRLDGELGLRPEDVLLDGFGLALLEGDAAVGSEAGFIWQADQAAQFGIEAGDVLLRAGEVEWPDVNTLAGVLRAADGEELTIEVLRDTQVVSLPGRATAGQDVDAVLAQFGVRSDDWGLRIGTIDNPTNAEFEQAFADADGEIVRVQVLRGGELVELRDTVSLNTSTPFRGFFGVGPTFGDPVDRGLGESIGLAIGDFATIAKTNIVGLASLANPTNWFGDDEPAVSRRAAALQPTAVQTTAPDGCDGPDTNRPLSIIGIGRLISCSDSADQVFFLFAVVNVFIGIFNLVPLLPLDGGHAAIATYEKARSVITRRPHRVDAAKLIPVTWLVILGLVGLGLWTSVLDIFSW